jgi:hypothetical protein
MAITQKRQDDFESLFANFANVPKPEITTDPEKKEKETKEKD